MLQRTFFATLVTSYVMLATLAALAVDPVALVLILTLTLTLIEYYSMRDHI